MGVVRPAPAVLPVTAATRIHSIDAFRVIANLTIICVHTDLFLSAAFDPRVQFLGKLFNQFVRVATPFFFLAAGYFFAISLSRGAQPLPHAAKLIRRLGLFFLFWSLVYLLLPLDLVLQVPAVSYWKALRYLIWRSCSIQFLLEGDKVHLWFLPALSCALALLATACRFRLERALLWAAVALYLVGLIAGAYKTTPIGLDLGINTRDGPFFSTIFVITGFMIHRLNIQFSVRQALGLIALGIALRMLELYWVSGVHDATLTDIDYLLGTYPFGVGIFMLLLRTQGLGNVGWMVTLSRYSAGVYCAHMLIVDLLGTRPLVLGSPLWELSRPFVELALTFALVIGLGRIRLLRPVVT